jgi:hypothetical protein
MRLLRSVEMLVFIHHTTERQIPEDRGMNIHRHENMDPFNLPSCLLVVWNLVDNFVHRRMYGVK